MLIFLFLSALLLLQINTNSRNSGAALYASFVIILFISGCYTNLDYENYEATYSFLADSDYGHEREWLYLLLKTLGNTVFHIDYNLFRLITVSCAVLIMYLAVRRLSPVNKGNVNLFFLLFMVFPLIWDTLVYRNFLAVVFFYYSINYLIESSKKSITFFIICIILASGIHNSFFAYFIFVLIFFLKEDAWTKLLRVLPILSLVLVLLTGYLIPYLQSIMSVIDETRNYTSQIDTKSGYLLFFFEQVMVCSIAYYGNKLKRMIVKNNANIVNGNIAHNMRTVEVIFYITILSFIFCPLYRVQGNFIRLLFNIVPLLYIQFGALKQLKYNCSSCVSLSNYSFAVIALAVILASLYYVFREDIMSPAFSDNWILEMF